MFLTTAITVASLLIATVRGSAVSYPRPSIYSNSGFFGLTVNGTSMYTVSYAGYDYAQLSMDEGYPTEFRVRISDQKSITSYSITPRRLPIKPKVEGNELVFSLNQAHYLIVKIDSKKEFVILADPSETDVPDPTGKGVFNVLHYDTDNTGGSVTNGIQNAMDAAAKSPGSTVFVPPGLYTIGNLLLRNKTPLYLAGGSVLRFTGKSSDYKTLYTKSDLFPGTWWIQTEFDSTEIKVFGRGAQFTNLKILNRFDVTQDDGIDIVESEQVSVGRTIAISKDDSFSCKTWPEDTGTTVPYPYPPRPLKDVWFDDCLAWTDCYGYKVGQGVWGNQDHVTFQNSVVYTAAVGMGIDHKFGTGTSSRTTFKNMDIEALHGNAHGQAAWMTIYVEQVGQGAGPVKDVYVKNIRVRQQGSRSGFLQGYNSSAMVSGVTFTNVYMGKNTVPAETLKDMNMLETSFSEDLSVINS
ncbi:Fc.00g082600.m01.CDS01 [Cosmosporella sp. VM-42]